VQRSHRGGDQERASMRGFVGLDEGFTGKEFNLLSTLLAFDVQE